MSNRNPKGSRKKIRLTQGSSKPGASRHRNASTPSLANTARNIMSKYVDTPRQPSSSSSLGIVAHERALKLMDEDASGDSSSAESGPLPPTSTKRDGQGRFVKRKGKEKAPSKVERSISCLATISRAHDETVYGFKDRRRKDEVPAKPSIKPPKPSKPPTGAASKKSPDYRVGQLFLVPYPPDKDGGIEVPDYPALRAYGLAKSADSPSGIRIPSDIDSHSGYMAFLREHFPDFDNWADEECTRRQADITNSVFFLAFKQKGKHGKFRIVKPAKGQLLLQSEYRACTFDATNDVGRRKIVLVSRWPVPDGVLNEWFEARNEPGDVPPPLRDDISSPSPLPPPKHSGYKRRRAASSVSASSESDADEIEQDGDAIEDHLDGDMSSLTEVEDVGMSDGDVEDVERDGAATRSPSPIQATQHTNIPSTSASATHPLVASNSSATVVASDSELAPDPNLIYASMQSLSMGDDVPVEDGNAVTGGVDIDFAPIATSTPVDVDLTGDTDSDGDGSVQSSEEDDQRYGYSRGARGGHRRVLPTRQQAPFRPRPTLGLSQALDPFAQ
ncbi:unnamed protein product [Peniophora sp. CBMAI 1063]|nr:unnamed protein product [Peniophora sp. CBMAI 1063]